MSGSLCLEHFDLEVEAVQRVFLKELKTYRNGNPAESVLEIPQANGAPL
jgi:hypothetical protein